MANPLMGFPNRIDEATVSGGSWSADLPLANVQNRRLYVPARTADLLKASTQLLVTFGDPRRVDLLALIATSLDPAARWRIKAGTNERTNSLLRSEALDNASWTKAAASVSADSALDAEGVQILDKLVEDTATSTHLARQDVALAPSQTLYASLEVAAAGRSIVLQLQDAAATGNAVSCRFDPATGTLSDVANAGNATGAAAAAEDLGGGNWRLSLQGQPNTSGTDTRYQVNLYNGGLSYAGDGASGAHLGRLDLGTAPGEYVATTTAAASGPDLRQYDSGWGDVYPVVYPADAVEWEDDAFFTGKPTAEDWQNLVQYAIRVPAAGVYAKHWRIWIDNTASAEAWLDIGRVWLGPAWQPTRNLMPGSVYGVIHPTLIDPAVNGAESYDPISAVRAASVTYHMLEHDEGLARAFDLMRRAGVHREILFVADPDDDTHLFRTSMLCRQDANAAMDFDVVDNVTPTFRLLELVA